MDDYGPPLWSTGPGDAPYPAPDVVTPQSITGGAASSWGDVLLRGLDTAGRIYAFERTARTVGEQTRGRVYMTPTGAVQTVPGAALYSGGGGMPWTLIIIGAAAVAAVLVLRRA